MAKKVNVISEDKCLAAIKALLVDYCILFLKTNVDANLTNFLESWLSKKITQTTTMAYEQEFIWLSTGHFRPPELRYEALLGEKFSVA